MLIDYCAFGGGESAGACRLAEEVSVAPARKSFDALRAPSLFVGACTAATRDCFAVVGVLSVGAWRCDVSIDAARRSLEALRAASDGGDCRACAAETFAALAATAVASFAGAERPSACCAPPVLGLTDRVSAFEACARADVASVFSAAAGGSAKATVERPAMPATAKWVFSLVNPLVMVYSGVLRLADAP
jgi:hypothetical protein